MDYLYIEKIQKGTQATFFIDFRNLFLWVLGSETQKQYRYDSHTNRKL